MMQEIFCFPLVNGTNHLHYMHYTINSKCDQFWMIYLTQRVNTFQSSGPLYIKSVYSDGYEDGMLIMSPHV